MRTLILTLTLALVPLTHAFDPLNPQIQGVTVLTKTNPITSGGITVNGAASATALNLTNTTTPQITMAYDSTHKTTFTTDSAGTLTIAPSSTINTLTGSLNLSGPETISITTATTSSSGIVVAKRGTTGDANAAIVSGTELGFHSFLGWDGTSSSRGAYVIAISTENWSGTAHGTKYQLFTTRNGETSNRPALTADSNQRILTGLVTSNGGQLEVLSTTEQLRLDFDTTHKASFTVDSSGNLTLAPSGGNLTLTGDISVGSLTVSGSVTLPSTIIAPGTTGNQTINKLTGRVNIAATGTSITVTNSLVTANSIIIAQAATNDSTCTVKNVVAGAGQFTINTVAATAETAINFRVTN